MAISIGSAGARLVGKLLFGAVLAGLAFHVTRLPARESATPAPKPKAAPRPAPEPVAPKLTPIAAPQPAPDDALIVKRVLNIAGPLDHGDYVWDDAGVPPGPIVVTVDLAAQTLSVFRGGYEIGVAVILYGANEKPSPLGAFPITAKIRDNFSRTYGNAPMPYSLRLTADGVFIHGSKVAWGSATHGCIGVPIDFAAKLFAQAKLGDRVIITNGKMMDLPAGVTRG